MILFSVYSIETGRVLRNMKATRIGLVDLQCDEGTSWVFGHWTPGQVISEITPDWYPVGMEPTPAPLPSNQQ